MSLLTEQGDRCQLFFAADFAPQAGFVHKLSAAAEAIVKKLPTITWHSTALQYLFRDETQHFLVVLDHKRLGCQAFGLKYWQDSLDPHGDLFKSIFQHMGVDSLTRIGFKVRAWVDLKMTYDEIRRLFFGSFLEGEAKISEVVGTLDDHLLQLEGERKGCRFVLVMSPMTKDQSKEAFRLTPNLSVMVEDRLMDVSIQGFAERLVADSLYVDIDLSRKELAPVEAKQFLKDSLSLICDMTDDVTRFLRSKPKRD